MVSWKRLESENLMKIRRKYVFRGGFPECRGLGEGFRGFRPQIRIQHAQISLGTSFEVSWLELKRFCGGQHVQTSCLFNPFMGFTGSLWDLDFSVTQSGHCQEQQPRETQTLKTHRNTQ